MSGDYADSGQAMLAAARLQAEKINKTGGIHGRPMSVVAFDSRSTPDRGPKLAKMIADSDAVAAVGGYFSSVSVKAAPVFKQQKMPVITGSATAPELVKHNPWYFRVVPDNNSKGRFSALYTDGVLNKHNVTVVFENDAYGKTLAQAYIAEARKLGMHIDHSFAVDSSQPGTGQRLYSIVHQLKQQQSGSGAIFVGLLGHDAAQLVAKLHAAGVNRTIIGGDAVGLDSFREAFGSLQHFNGSIASATSGIFATTYFLPDLGNQQSQAFISAFRARYKREPRPVAAPYYDAVGMIAAALQKTQRAASTRALRNALRHNLQKYHALDTAYQGVTGRLFFNVNGGVVKPSSFGMYSRGELISAPIQLTPTGDHPAAGLRGNTAITARVVSLDGRSYDKTDIVYTGIRIKNIRNIETRKSTFNADFYLWFRAPASSNFNPRQVFFERALRHVHLGQPVARNDNHGRRYIAFRTDANFNADFNFRRFPFDSQTLAIRLRPKDKQANLVKLVPDRIGMNSDGRVSNSNVLNHSHAWRLSNIRVFADTDSTQSSLGNPALLQSHRKSHIDFSRLNILVHVKRQATSYVLSNLAPLFFVMLLGYTMLYVPVEGPPFTARINLGVLALLTTVSFSMKTSRELPDVSYLTLLDFLYFAVYILLLYGITSSTLKLHWVKRGYTTRVHWLEWTSRVLMPVFAVIILLVWFAWG